MFHRSIVYLLLPGKIIKLFQEEVSYSANPGMENQLVSKKNLGEHRSRFSPESMIRGV
jgi:hypothetical protein